MDAVQILLIALVVVLAAWYLLRPLTRSRGTAAPGPSAEDIIERCAEQRKKIAQVNRERAPSARR